MSEKASRVDSIFVALEMEKRGHDLYVRAQQLVDDSELIALLKRLAADEVLHHKQFEAMLEDLGEMRVTREEAALSKARAADVFLPGGLMQVAMEGALDSTAAMLDEAIKAEQDSIVFYGTLLEHVSKQQQGIIAEIIRQEENHLQVLLERKNRQNA